MNGPPPDSAHTPERPPRGVEPGTLGVVSALIALGAAWLIWARLTAVPGGGLGWSALDAIRAASADRQRSEPAPAFVLADPAGQTFALEDLRGQVVLVNFWATWCVPCRAEMPELDSLAREYGPRGFRVLAVNIMEDAGPVQRFGEDLRLDLPLLLDPEGDVYRAYRVQGLPTNILVDADGTINDVRLGVVTRAYLEARLPALLDGRDPL